MTYDEPEMRVGRDNGHLGSTEILENIIEMPLKYRSKRRTTSSIPDDQAANKKV